VVAEKYDEVVFTNPKTEFHKSLVDGNKKSKPPFPLSNEQSVLEHFRTYGDEEDIKTMLAAKKFLEGELRNVKDRLLNVDAELNVVKQSLAATKEMELSAGQVTSGRTATVGSGVASGGNAKGGTSGAGGSKARSKSKKKAAAAESQSIGKKAKTG